MCTPTQGVWQPAGCVSCELVCVCVSLVRVVIICPASTHTALVSSPSLTIVHLSTYIHTVCAPTTPVVAHCLLVSNEPRRKNLYCKFLFLPTAVACLFLFFPRCPPIRCHRASGNHTGVARVGASGAATAGRLGALGLEGGRGQRHILGWVFRHCGVGTPIDPHDLLRSLRWTPVGVGPQPGYTRRLGKQ